MIPYDIDPSLHAGHPEPDRLEDGFSPPAAEEAVASCAQPAELTEKSAF